jgi:antitoxin component YwqK of YwqJK toxin-antitoxin module
MIVGKDTGYYASGRIKYRGQHKDGKQVGTWTWYNEDGSVQSKKDYSKQ